MFISWSPLVRLIKRTGMSRETLLEHVCLIKLRIALLSEEFLAKYRLFEVEWSAVPF